MPPPLQLRAPFRRTASGDSAKSSSKVVGELSQFRKRSAARCFLKLIFTDWLQYAEHL